ncbi:hypothetical protein, partial [Pedobacter sp. GR22-6]|uniref:hypothetical protein n=1 Tax=Pedobacter sp. GR22-6 TaxID=3127957 RepID=UPI00307DDF6E
VRPYWKDDKGKANWKLIETNAKPFGKAGAIAIAWNKPYFLFNEVVLPFLKTNPGWESLQKKVDGLDIERRWKIDVYKNVVDYYLYYPFGKDPDPNLSTVIRLFNFYLTYPNNGLKDGNKANDMAWMAFNRFKDTEDLRAALLWSRIAMGYSGGAPAPEDIDTYANLLYKLGEKEQAILQETIALQKSPGNKEFTETLQKMKTGLKTWQE